MTIPFPKEKVVGQGWFIKPGVKVRSIQSQEAFGNPLVARVQTLTNITSIVSGEGVGTPGLVYNQFVTAGGIASAEAFGGSVSSPGAVNIGVTAIASAQAIGTATIARGPVAITGMSGIASGEAFGSTSVANPPNMVLDPGLENVLPAYANGAGALSGRSTEQSRSGTTSYKLVAHGGGSTLGRFYFMNGLSDTPLYAAMGLGDLIYVEFWVRKASTNSTNSQFNIYVQIVDDNLANPEYVTLLGVNNNNTNDSEWTKFTALYRHSHVSKSNIMIFAQMVSSATAGETWYIDDVQIVRTQELSAISAENLATDPTCSNPSVWISDAAVAREVSNDFAHQGTTSAKITKITSINAYLNTSTANSGSLKDVLPGETVRAEVMVYRPSGSYSGARLWVDFRDSNSINSPQILLIGQTSSLAVDAWTKLSGEIACPNGYDRFRVIWDNPSAAAVGSVHYLDSILVEKIGIGAPSVEYGVNPLPITDDSQLATDPQVDSPHLWKQAASAAIDVVEEDGFQCVKLTRTVSPGVAYSAVTHIRSVSGANNNSSVQFSVQPGDKITFGVDVKNDSANTGQSRAFAQINIRDSNGINPTVYAATNSVTALGVWTTAMRAPYIIPEGYDGVYISAYLHINDDLDNIAYLRNFFIQVERVSNHGVSTGPVSLSPTGIASQEVFGGSITSPGPASILPQAIASGEVFGAVAMAPSQPLLATAIDSEEAFGSNTISVGPVSFAPSGIASAEAFGTQTIGRGAVNLTPPQFDDGNVWGTPTFTVGDVNLAPTAIASVEAFGTQVVGAGAVGITASAIDDGGSQTGSPVISVGAVNISPSAISDADGYGSPTVFVPQAYLVGTGTYLEQNKSSATSHTFDPIAGPTFTATTGNLVLCHVIGYKSSSSSITMSATYGGAAMSATDIAFGNGSNSSNTSYSIWFWIFTTSSGQNIVISDSTPGFATPYIAVQSWAFSNVASVANYAWEGGTETGTAMSITITGTTPGSIVLNSMVQEVGSGGATAPSSHSATTFLEDFFPITYCAGIVGGTAGGGDKTFTAVRETGVDYHESVIELLPIAA